MDQTGGTGRGSSLQPWDSYKPAYRIILDPVTGFENQETMHKSSAAISAIGAAVLLGGIALIVLGTIYTRSFAIIPRAAGIGAGSAMVALGAGGIGVSIYLFKKGYWNDPSYLAKDAREIEENTAITYSEIVRKYAGVVPLNRIIPEANLYLKFMAEFQCKTFEQIIDSLCADLPRQLNSFILKYSISFINLMI